MYDFEFYEPENLPEALELLKGIPDARIVAGGTDMIVLMKDLLQRPSALVSLAGPRDLVGIQAQDGGLTIGPMTPLWHLEQSAELGRKYPALRQAALNLATPPIRNVATLGGNICLDTKCIFYNQSHVWERSLARCLKAGGDICHVTRGRERCVAVLSGDTVGPLWAYGAELTLSSFQGTRQGSVRQFYSGDGLKPHNMTAGEVVTRVHLPAPQPRTSAAYFRFASRKALEFSQFNLTAAISVDDQGRIASARLLTGAIGPAPVEINQSLIPFQGQFPSEKLWAKAAKDATRETVRLSRSPHLTAYLREALTVYTEQLLKEAFQLAESRTR